MIDEFTVSDASWNEKKTLYLNSDFSITSDMTIATDEDFYIIGDSQATITGGTTPNLIELTVNGSLICKGSSTKKPEFRSSTSLPGSWDFITLTSSSSGHTFENTIFRHAKLAIRGYAPVTVKKCDIGNGIDGIQAYGNMTILNTTIHDIAGTGVIHHAGNVSIDKLEVYNALQGLTQGAPNAGPLVCTRSHFHDLSYSGILLSLAAPNGVNVRRTTIERAHDGVKCVNQTAVTVDSCLIRNNDIGLWAIVSPNVIVKRTRFDGNTTVGVHLYAYSIATLEADTVSNSPTGVLLDLVSDATIKNETRITGNTVGLKCDNNSNPVVQRTLISGNTTGVLTLNGSDLPPES